MLKGNRKSARMGIRIDADLKAWAERYAQDRRTNVTQLITDHFVKLRDQHGRRANVKAS